MRVMNKDVAGEPGQLRVWHIPQVPGTPFVAWVDSREEADALQQVLQAYDVFQLRENIKPDYSSVTGLERWEGDAGWEEVYDEAS